MFKTSEIFFLTAASLSFLGSVYLFFFVQGQETHGLFVAIWVPSLLSLANYLRGRERHQ
jgi:hypothetical protein